MSGAASDSVSLISVWQLGQMKDLSWERMYTYMQSVTKPTDRLTNLKNAYRFLSKKAIIQKSGRRNQEELWCPERSVRTVGTGVG
jgi:hypothetical protein